MRQNIEGRVYIVGVLAELASGKRITHSQFSRFMDEVKNISENENEPKCREWVEKFNELLGCVYGKTDGSEVREMYKNDAFYAVEDVCSGKKLCVTNSLEFAEEYRDKLDSVLRLGISVHDYDTALSMIREDDGIVRRFY